MSWSSGLALVVLIAGAAALGSIGRPASAGAAGGVPISRYEPPTDGRSAQLRPGFGAVAHGVDEEGTLWLAVSVRGATPEAPHEVSLVCGPTVAESCGYRVLFVLVTDRDGGADSAEVAVRLADLSAAPFGPGERNDHVTIVDPLGGPAYVSDPLRYELP